MRTRLIILLTTLLVTVGCGFKGHNERARRLLQQAQTEFEQGNYTKSLASIEQLRAEFPEEIETRKEALKLYQEVSLKQAQEELAYADSALQVAQRDYEAIKAKVDADFAKMQATAEDFKKMQQLKNVRDSLQAKFDQQCAKIKYIHRKQKEV